MAHPKSMYQVTAEGVQEKIAESFEEEWAMAKGGWFPHPEEARQAFVPGEEKPEEKKALADMNKEEIEVYARQFGVELDRRKSRKNMLNDLEDALK
jgi:hypothetical protein